MKIFVDENIPKITVEALRAGGNDVVDIRGTPKEGLSDKDIWEIVRKEKRLLITTDKGFAKNREEPHQGILLVCLKNPNRKGINLRILTIMEEIPAGDWDGLLVTIKDTVKHTWRNVVS